MKTVNIFRILKVIAVFIVVFSIGFMDISMVQKAASIAVFTFSVALIEYAKYSFEKIVRSEGWT